MFGVEAHGVIFIIVLFVSCNIVLPIDETSLQFFFFLRNLLTRLVRRMTGLSGRELSHRVFALSRRVLALSRRVFPLSRRVFPLSRRVFALSRRVFALSRRVFPLSRRVFPLCRKYTFMLQ